MSTETAAAYDGHDLEALADLPRYHAWILDTFRPFLSGHAAELGAGIGTLTAKFQAHVERLDAIEPSPNLVPRLRKRCENGRIEIFPQSLESYLGERPDASRDALIMINVLEHVENDRGVLAECRRVLRHGHHLLLFVPALPGLYAAIDAALGHHRRYRLAELVGKVEEAGLTVELAEYRDVIGALAWWLVHKKLGRTRFSPRLAHLYDAIGVPLTRLLERPLRFSFGKNIILVARR